MNEIAEYLRMAVEDYKEDLRVKIERMPVHGAGWHDDGWDALLWRREVLDLLEGEEAA